MHTMDLRTRVTIYCGDRRYGILREVVVDPNDGHITDLVIEPAAHPATVRVVPVSLVTRVDINKVHLGLTARQIDRYPAYPQRTSAPIWVNPLEKRSAPQDEPSVNPKPAVDRLLPEAHTDPQDKPSPTPAMSFAKDTDAAEGRGAPIFAPGTPVLCGDGHLVTVARVCVDPVRRQRIYLTLHHRQAGSYRLVPAQRTRPGSDGILITAEAWNKLPVYLPRKDGELYEEIRAVVVAQVETIGDGNNLLDVTVQSGFVTLLGTVKEPKLLDGVVARISAIPGVIDLRADVDVSF